ncbi:MAG: SHOCT domain-containing protein [Candidatus Limnocylindria bacterium]
MGGGMWWGMLFPALVLVALSVGGIVLFRTLSDRSGDDSGPDSAISVLEERFARGEIDDQEFKARRDELLIGKG